MSDPESWGDQRTEDRVRRAIADHTADVEVAPDAYAKLATRIAEADDGPRWRRIVSTLPPVRIAVTAVAAAAIVAGGVAVLNTDDQIDDESVAIADGEESDGTSDGADEAAPSTPETSDGGDGGGDPDAAGGAASSGPAGSLVDGSGGADVVAGLGPVRSTKLEAAEAFLAIIGISGPVELSVDGDQVVVTGFGEGGAPIDRVVARLELVAATEEADSWVVASASSDTVTLAAPTPLAVVESGALVAAGEGEGFERQVDLSVRSAIDGRLLATGGTQAGQGEIEPFEAALEVAGTDRVWVIAQSGGGADGVVEPFAAVPVAVDGPADTTEYVVATVPIDDPDGGLNVRTAPNPGAGRLTVAAWGEAVTRTPGEYPMVSGDNVWWPIMTADRISGWVNARFLAAAPGPDAADLEPALDGAAQSFLFAASEPAVVGPWLPVSERLGFTVVADGETVRLDAAPLREPEGWATPVVGGRSLAELISAPAAPQDELVTTPGAAVDAGGAVAEVAERYFGGLSNVTATYVGADGVERTIHLFFESGQTGPSAIGVIVE